MGWRPILRRMHGWLALATGVVLLAILLSGVALVFQPELDKLLHPGLYDATETENPISPKQALAEVERQEPDFPVGDTIVRNRGVYEVYSRNFMRQAHVDPGTGEVLGIGNHEAGVLGFLANLHMCGLSCKDYPGYVGFLHERIRILGNPLNVGTLILCGGALVLIFMCISGLALWWPGVRRMARGFKVRRGGGAYKTNYDLHKVVGFAAIPFLLFWAVTGLGFELKQIEDAWYALTPGDEPKREFVSFESKPDSGNGVGPGEAERLATTAVPGSKPISITLPADNKKGYYDVWIQHDWDSLGSYVWPGNTEVGVDQHSGETKILYGDPDESRPASQVLWSEWLFASHAGYLFGPLPRSVWFIFGLTPLLLAITGTAVWWIRRRKRKRKRPA